MPTFHVHLECSFIVFSCLDPLCVVIICSVKKMKIRAALCYILSFCCHHTISVFCLFNSAEAVTRGRSIHQRLAQFSTTMEAIQAKSEPLEIDEEEIP